jgi:hypothetical protein
VQKQNESLLLDNVKTASSDELAISATKNAIIRRSSLRLQS